MSTPRPASRFRPSAPRTSDARVTTTLALAALAASAFPARAQRIDSSAAGDAHAAPAAFVHSASGVSLRGVVYDSLARGPLADALVQVVRAGDAAGVRTIATDSTGAFRFDSLPPGRYLLGFLHPLLDLLAIELAPVTVVVDSRPLPTVTLAVPGPSAVRTAVCPPTTPGDSSGAVAGSVRHALTGDAVTGATVVLSWPEMSVTRHGVQRETRRVPATVRADGGFLFCGVPTDAPVSVSASAPGVTSGLVEVAVHPRAVVVQRLAVGAVAAPAELASPADSATDAERGGLARPAHGTARLVGRVVGPDTRPVGGAQVRVSGTGASATSDADGRFALADLPSGTFTVDVRGIGLAPSRTPVDLANAHTATLAVALAKAVPQLERVTVMGKPTARSRFLEEFTARRRTGQGQYFNADEIAARRPIVLSDLLRTAASLQVTPGGTRGHVLRGRGGCLPAIWVDGNLERGGANAIDDVVPPQAVQAIEIYGSSAAVPMQYNISGAGGPRACGAVLIWTMH
ncbi:MAG TPA: carboxypeptidase regulatory-like domain-containing protein [Gemmatirosa sp.]